MDNILKPYHVSSHLYMFDMSLNCFLFFSYYILKVKEGTVVFFLHFLMLPFEEQGVYCFANVGLSISR